jgi:hypothetical protein
MIPASFAPKNGDVRCNLRRVRRTRFITLVSRFISSPARYSRANSSSIHLFQIPDSLKKQEFESVIDGATSRETENQI